MNNSRRSFIKNSSATLAGLGLMEFFPSDIYAKMRNKVGANDKINIGLIGLKNQGFNNIRAFLKIKDVNVLAICDIDDEQINKRKDDLAKLGANNLLVYKDYRKLLENKDIDAVLIATPDHWHCLQLTDALSAGKHVYCEKPIANSILEARAMVHATQKSGKVVQVNQWQRSEKHFQDAVAYVQSGKLAPNCIWDYLYYANTALFETPIYGAQVYRSDNAGLSWVKTHVKPIELYSTYGYYFGKVFVSPSNPDKIAITGVSVLLSTDGGKTFNAIGKDMI